jgi:hypothetical protein
MAWQKRKNTRNLTNIPCRIRLNPCLELRGVVLDLSNQGLALSAPLSFTAGDEVDVDFLVADEFLDLHGRIVWADDTGRAGIEFESLDASMSRRLQSHLRQSSSRSTKV